MSSKYATYTAIFIFAFCVNTYAVQVSVPELSATSGSKITITIDVDDTSGIIAGDIVLEYDPDFLLAKEVRTTDLTKSLTLIANIGFDGKVILSMAGTHKLKEGSGAMVEIDFEVKSGISGESYLTLSDVVLYDEMSNEISVEVLNGKVTVQKAEIPTAPWDVNDDGEVNIFDLVMVGSSFGKTGDNLTADVNDDDKVDIFDLVLVGSHFGEKAAPTKDNTVLLKQIYDILKAKSKFYSDLKLVLKDLEKLLVLSETKLLQNYPNPFNPDTWIPYQLKESSEVTVSIYDISGKLIRRLELGYKKEGFYLTKSKAAYWEGCNQHGEKVSSGTYFYHLQAGDYSSTRRMLILK